MGTTMAMTKDAGRWASVLAVGALLCAATAPASGAVEDAGRLGANMIVFSSLRAEAGGVSDDIYVRAVGGGGERRLTTADGQDGAAMVSPDRRTIAFASERTGRLQLWTMDIDGTDQQQLLSSDSLDFHPAWSHDGRTIVFQRLSPTTGFDLWTLDVVTGAQRQLTSLPRNEVGAFFSPDDRWIVFQGNSGPSRDVWLVPSEGGTPVAVSAGRCVDGTDPCVLSDDVHPSWTPDGRLLFVSNRAGSTGIWTMGTDGADATEVIDLGGAAVAMPSMSADGQRITFSTDAHAPGGDRNVHTVRSDGQQLRRLPSAGDDIGPTFAAGS